MVGLISAVQRFSHPFTFNLPWSLGGYMKKLSFWSPWGYYFTPGFVRSQHTGPGILNLHRHCPLRVPIHTLVEWRLFLYEVKFTLGQCRIRTTDPSICRRTRYHWTNAPRVNGLYSLVGTFLMMNKKRKSF